MSRGRQRTVWTALLSGKQQTGQTIDPTEETVHRSYSDGNGVLAMMDVFFADGCIQWVDLVCCVACGLLGMSDKRYVDRTVGWR
jgi:hypothetical protein